MTADPLHTLVSDWQANGNSRPLGDPTADVWHKAARQLLTALCAREDSDHWWPEWVSPFVAWAGGHADTFEVPAADMPPRIRLLIAAWSQSPVHLLDVTPDGWSLLHPAAGDEPCPVEPLAEDGAAYVRAEAGPGVFAVTVNGDGGLHFEST